MSIGGLVAYQALLGSFMAPVSVLVGLAGKLQTIKADLARVDDVLSANEMQHRWAADPDRSPASMSGRVELDRVMMDEQSGELSGHPLSFSAMPGMQVGIIGPAGSGKTVIADLVAGLVVLNPAPSRSMASRSARCRGGSVCPR